MPLIRPTGSIRISGSDSVTVTNIPITLENGAIISRMLITPSLSPRLAAHAVCYNEIKYHRLTFRVNGQASSLTQGSTIMAFCSDPEDTIPQGAAAIPWARSQMCSRSGKYWETITLNIPSSQMHGPNDGFFKNSSSSSLRTYSPGFAALIAITAPNNETPLEVELTWDVTLRAPTFNPIVETNEGVPLTSKRAFTVVGQNGPDGPFVPWASWWDGNAWNNVLATDFSPPMQPNVYYEVAGAPMVQSYSATAANDGVGRRLQFIAIDTTQPESSWNESITFYSYNYDGTLAKYGMPTAPRIDATPYFVTGTVFPPVEPDLGF